MYPKKESDIVTTGSSITVLAETAGAKRGISSYFAGKYGFHLGRLGDEQVGVFVYRDRDGNDVGLKARTVDKKFIWSGRGKVGFFGQHLAGSVKTVVVTEGEIDAMSVATATGNRFEVAVSLPDGAGTAAKVFKEQMDWLLKFENIVLAFDMDEPGRKAVEAVARMLPPGRCKVVSWERKDANEVLIKDGPERVKWSVAHARPFQPSGLVSGDELWDRLVRVRAAGLPYPFRFLNEALHGQRLGEITTWLAGSGVGKSTIVGQIAAHNLMENDAKLGLIFLEDNIQEAMLRILSIVRGENLMMKFGSGFEDLRDDYNKVFNGKAVMYDPESGWDAPRIAEAIRWMVVGEGCQVVILDHLSATVGAESSDQQVGKTEELCYLLRATITQNPAHLHMISHLRKRSTKDVTHEEGGRVTMQDAKGSGAIYQVSNTMIGLERNTQAETPEERDITTVRILKGRLTGLTGESGKLFYDRETYRLVEHNGTGATPFSPFEGPPDRGASAGVAIPF